MGRKNSENIENTELEVTTEAQTEVTTEAQTEVTTEAQTEVTTEAQTEVTTEAQTEVTTEAVNTLGMVDNCAKLNVRKLPNKSSDVLTVVSKGTSISINLDKSTDDFYCVTVLIDNEFTEGYCMKEFIEIR